MQQLKKKERKRDKSGSRIHQFLAFVEPKDSLSCLQEPQFILKRMSLTCFLMLPSCLRFGRPKAQLPLGISIALFYAFFIFFFRSL